MEDQVTAAIQEEVSTSPVFNRVPGFPCDAGASGQTIAWLLWQY